MRGYFWHKLKETEGKYEYRKDGKKRNNKRNRQLSSKEEFYRAMALKKVGSVIRIPERRFIGHGRNTDRIIREIVEGNFEAFCKLHKIINQ